MSTLDLPGLDPLDPLGFLAALGVLAAATDDAAGRGSPPPKLSFAVGPRPQARLQVKLVGHCPPKTPPDPLLNGFAK